MAFISRRCRLSLLPSLLLGLLCSTLQTAAQLPSCEGDIEKHCLGEDNDMSSEGIARCLAGMEPSIRSKSCNQFLTMIEGCTEDFETGGVCAEAHRNGETAACLIQRVSIDQLSSKCAAALPKQAPRTGLRDKFWADGKRVLGDDEVAELNSDDKEDYRRWLKRKKAPKSGKDKERAYAVRTQKTLRATEQVTEEATAAAAEALAKGESKHMASVMATKVAREAAERAVEEDMTGTLKKFTEASIKSIAKKAVDRATSAKNEL
eukprot:6173203-Pleurochrysis_carterae.AAC.5